MSKQTKNQITQQIVNSLYQYSNAELHDTYSLGKMKQDLVNLLVGIGKDTKEATNNVNTLINKYSNAYPAN